MGDRQSALMPKTWPLPNYRRDVLTWKKLENEKYSIRENCCHPTATLQRMPRRWFSGCFSLTPSLHTWRTSRRHIYISLRLTGYCLCKNQIIFTDLNDSRPKWIHVTFVVCCGSHDTGSSLVTTGDTQPASNRARGRQTTLTYSRAFPLVLHRLALRRSILLELYSWVL